MTGEYIKEKRKALNLSQAQLAKLVGVGKNTIYNYESGAKIPESKIPILELVLNSKEEVLNDKKEKTPQETARFEDLVAEKVVEILDPYLTGFGKSHKELVELLGNLLLKNDALKDDVEELEEKVNRLENIMNNTYKTVSKL